MNKNISLSTPASYLKLVAWAFLTVFAGNFIIKDALPYFDLQQDYFGRFWNVKWWLVGHITGGLLALVVGPFQFWKSFRTKYITIHRWLGRTYLVAILTGTICSTYLAWTSGLAIHWSWAIALQGLALAWICTAAMAYISIIKRRIEQHREWMIRSYVVTFAFVIFRWLNELTAVKELGNFVERGPTEIWVSWAIPLFVTEIILQWKKK